MNKICFLGLWLAVTLRVQAEGCGDPQTPVTRRVVVTWNGQSDSELFDKSVVAFDRYLGRRSSLHLLGLGARLVAQNSDGSWLVERAHRPEAAANQKIFDADEQGFLNIARAIRADFDAEHAKSGIKPANYEIDLMVTNHGVVWTGPQQDIVGFGLGTMPPGLPLSPQDLKDFAALLPDGVRFKMVSGVCYGGESTDALVEAVRSKQNSSGCSCGLSVAAPGSVAKTTTVTQHDGTVIPPWEGLIATYGGTSNTTLLRALWRSMGQTPMGKMGEEPVPGLRDLRPVDNAPLSSSERLVMQYFSSQADDWESVEADASKRLELARKDPNARTDNDPALTGAFAASKRERRLAAAELLGVSVTAANLDAKIQEAVQQGSPYGDLQKLKETSFERQRAAVKVYNDYITTGDFAQAKASYKAARKAYQDYDLSDVRVGAESDAALRQTKLDEYARLKAAFDAADARYTQTFAEAKRLESLIDAEDAVQASLETRKAQVAVAKLMAREKLEEAFLRTATAAQVERYEQLRKCELESFGPGPESAQKDSSKADSH